MTGLRRPACGLTLAETIVVIFVFSLLLVTIIQLLQGGIAAWKKGNSQTKVRAGLRKAMDEVTADLRTMDYLHSTMPYLLGQQLPEFQFNRFVNTPGSSGPYSSVTTKYILDATTNTLQKIENGVTVVVAEDIVVRSGGSNASFFQVLDPAQGKVYVQLCSAEGASSGGSATVGTTSQMTLATTVVGFAYPNVTDAPRYPTLSVQVPTSIENPGRPFRRSPSTLR